MSVCAMIGIVVVAVLHALFAWIEMARWEARGAKIVPEFDAEMLRRTKAMAANMGIYNLLLAVGLLYALTISDPAAQHQFASYLLVFIVIVGLYGAATISKKIAFVQALPAAAAIACLLFT